MSGGLSGTEVTPTNTDNRRNWVEFVELHIEDRSYKLELGCVKRIVRNPPITEVPQAESAIAGVTNIGGELAVVIDGRPLFDLAPRSADEDAVLLLFDRPNGQPTGLLVDDVPGIDPHHVDHIRTPREFDDWDPQLSERWFRAVVDERDVTNHPTGVLALETIVTEARERS